MNPDLDFGLWALELRNDDDFVLTYSIWVAAMESWETGRPVTVRWVRRPDGSPE